MAYNREKPYNDLPALPPAVDVETTKVLKKVITASRALAELKGAIKNLPNPTLFIDTINLQEAQASSAIENIVTTQDELFKASIAGLKIENQATKEVIHYRDALWHGIKELERNEVLTTNLFIKLVQIIKENTQGIRTNTGTQISNLTTGEILYTPPEGEDLIRTKLKELEEFIHNDELDPLIKMALIHYQFEAIHPFSDGNGRTGRILLLLSLKYANLVDLPALYLSRYIIEHKDRYYRYLRAVTEKGWWQTWILFMLETIEETALKGRKQISEIERLMSDTGVFIKAALPKVYSKDLLEALFRLPYIKRQNLYDLGLGTLKTVGGYLIELESHGFLKSEQVGKEKLYLNHKLMEILKR